MILKASTRGNARNLARHLLNRAENDYVEVHEIKHLFGDNLFDAFAEMDVIRKGTRCEKFLFSVSLNPPQNETPSPDVFKHAVSEIEQSLGLAGQPRVLVFHEKEGRRHAHCVWSRIDSQRLKAIELPFFKQKLFEISRNLYLKYNWDMPQGYFGRHYTNPCNFTLAQWQQAKRSDEDPRMLKALFKSLIDKTKNASDMQRSFKEHGFILAKGDRRGFIVMDYRGEIYSLSRWSGVKARDLKAILGTLVLPDVKQARIEIIQAMTPTLASYIDEIKQDTALKFAPLKEAAITLREHHTYQRQNLQDSQRKRLIEERQRHQERLPKGFKGFLSRMLGSYGKIMKENALEAERNYLQDRDERQALADEQLKQRQRLQEKIVSLREEHKKDLLQMRKDIGDYMQMLKDNPGVEPKFVLRAQKQQMHNDDYEMEM